MARLPLRIAVLLVVLGAAALPPRTVAAPAPADAPAEDDGSTTEWNQWGGNAARTFAAALEPVRSEPRVLWRAPTQGPVVGGPVCWGGVAVVATRTREDTTLRAFSLADGKPIGTHFLGKCAPHVGLAAWQGTFAVADGSTLRGIRHQGAGFTRTWTAKEIQGVDPAVADGNLFAVREGRVMVLDATSGREGGLTKVQTAAPPALSGKPSSPGLAGVAPGFDIRYAGTLALLHVAGAFGDAPESSIYGTFHAGYGSAVDPYPLRLLRIPAGDSAEEGGGWFLLSESPLGGKGATFPSASRPDGPGNFTGGLCTISLNPTCRRGSVTGFAANGDLVSIQASGRYRIVVQKAQLPAGARPGPAGRAGPVATFGNWAVDIDSRRVLWCLPGLELEGGSLPVADRTLLGIEKGGGLVCLTDRPAPAPAEPSPAATAPGADAASTAPAGPPTAPAPAPAPADRELPPPSGKDGLLFADGREVEGAVEALGDGRFRVVPAAGGAAIEAAASELLLAQAGDRVLHRGRERDLLVRWRAHLRPATVRTLVEIHGILSKEALLRACRTVLDEAREWGLSDEGLAAISRETSGRQENRFGEKRLEALRPVLAEKRAAARDRFLAAAEWCRTRDLGTAAACLLGDAGLILPGDPAPPERAAKILPKGFPWASAADAGALWILWAREMVDAGAEFVAEDEPIRTRVRSGPWAVGGGALVFRTPDVIFRTLCKEPAVVGRCLRNSEWTVGALTELLGPEAVRPVTGDAQRMDVRLHATEADYRAEKSPLGGYPMPWSAGYYSPLEGVSRFYVPGREMGDALGRGLFHVLSHELTHHFVEHRWKAARPHALIPPGNRGFWCVEGLARFVEDQVVEMDRRGLRFDDPTVPSLESTARAMAKDVLVPPSLLFDLSIEAFGQLPVKEILRVTLRNTLTTRSLSGIGLFYEESGASVYYLVNGRGREGRLTFLSYLSIYYSGKDPGPGWKALGYTSREDCDSSFRAFFEKQR